MKHSEYGSWSVSPIRSSEDGFTVRFRNDYEGFTLYVNAKINELRDIVKQYKISSCFHSRLGEINGDEIKLTLRSTCVVLRVYKKSYLVLSWTIPAPDPFMSALEKAVEP